MRVSQVGINLIKSFEGCRLVAYKDAAGVPTIGYGHTMGVKMGQTITQSQAEQMFVDDVTIFSDRVASLVKVSITQNQFDALTSLAYNIGVGGLKTSTLLEYLNAGNVSAAANEFGKWIHAG
jgi:GH24 family phage-related lysozyme (muramidase)